MDFRVLGPLQVVGPTGIRIDLVSAAQRRLTSMLVLRAGTIVSADVLADHLELSPGALRTSVSRLRRVLGASTLVTTPPGYELRADRVDVQDFECLLAQARSGDAGVMSGALEAALALWRGDAYVEFAHEAWAMTEARRLAELRIGAIEDLVEMLLDRGESTAAIAHLEPVIAGNPFRDNPRALLMRALVGSGRRVHALRAFQDYRNLLIEEVGTEPSAELVTLDREIARGAVCSGGQVAASTVSSVSVENVTVLCSEMTDSTESAVPVSADAAHEVRRAHLSILRQAVAQAGGDEIDNQGDGLMVVFATASAALACAVAMQQGVEGYNRAQDCSGGLRVGLSGGDVVRQSGDYTGDPVHEAARLAAAAHDGHILAASVVRAMAGRRSPHQCGSVGTLVLNGSLNPVEAVEVLWRPLAGAAAAGVPLPPPLARRQSPGVVGREVELTLIADAAKRVAGGEGREVLLISGEAGQGKTTLVAEAARVAFEESAVVVFGHCEEDLATPYQLFAEALTHYVSHVDEEQLSAHVAAHGVELGRLVPALASRLPGLPPSRATDLDAERYLLFAAVVGLLAQASQHQPVVLVLDDLQWADAGSLELLRHLTAAEQPMRLLVLGAYRDTELSHTHPLLDTLAALHRQLRVARVELTGLDDTGVVSLMEAAAGHSLDGAAVDLARAVHRETDGNPFFVGEVLRHLVETGAIHQDADGRWVGGDILDAVGLPDSVREVIGSRVGRLGASAARVLSLAAVIGRDFDFDVLASASVVSEDELLDVLDAAVAAALVRELSGVPGRYSFAHALIQHTLYADLGPTRRARAHRLVAEALETLARSRSGRRVGELARHWFCAGQPQYRSKAIEYSRLAADAALRALAPGEAIRYYRQALDLCAQSDDLDPVLDLDLGIGLGTAQRQSGDPAFRDTLLDVSHKAADLGDTERLVAAALANDRGWYTAAAAVDVEKVGVLETALDRLAPESPDRALVLATLCSELSFGSPLERRCALAEEALALAAVSSDDVIITRVLNSVYYSLQVPPLLEQSLARTADAMARAERVNDAVLLFSSSYSRHLAAYLAGDIDEMDRCLEIMGSLAEKLDQPMLHWTHTFARATRALIAGDTDRAEQLVVESLQLGTDSGQPDAMLYFGLQLLATRFQCGTLSDLIPLLEQMATEMSEALEVVNAGLALAHIEGDRTEDARLFLEAFASSGFDLVMDPLWVVGMVSYAEVAIECHDPKFAGPLFDRLAPWADQWATSGISAQGPVSHYLGGLATALGHYHEADRYYTRAAAANERVGARFFAARTHLSWGRMLAERQAPGDREKARALLTKAHSAATSYGYANVQRRAAAALQRLDH